MIDALVLCSTFGMAMLLGTRLFNLNRNTAMLIGAGSSICGAAAVVTTEPVLRAQLAQVTVAVATVVVFGSLAIFLYTLLYHINLHWHFLAARLRHLHRFDPCTKSPRSPAPTPR